MNKIIVIMLAIGLTSCSTGYHASNFWRNGYSETLTSDDSFLVTFEGNEWTTKKDTKKFAMMRASELTLRNGYQFFEIVKEEDNTTECVRTTKKEDTVIEGVTTWLTEGVDMPSVTLYVKCHHTKPHHASSIDASYFLRNNRMD